MKFAKVDTMKNHDNVPMKKHNLTRINFFFF
uniref:Uncharacterized protein n=1 Tax=Rhizophora mucronata TaxID=61149 RepID=A0A2P2QNF3_RHIMU